MDKNTKNEIETGGLQDIEGLGFGANPLVAGRD